MSVMKLFRYQRDKIDNSELRELRRAEIRWGLLPCMEIKKDTQPTRGSVSFIGGADHRPCDDENLTGMDSGVNIA